jgi:hypothetical protein
VKAWREIGSPRERMLLKTRTPVSGLLRDMTTTSTSGFVSDGASGSGRAGRAPGHAGAVAQRFVLALEHVGAVFLERALGFFAYLDL